jgi:phosphopantetheine adenylyltransferase
MRGEIDVGIIITLDEMAYQRWGEEAAAYKAARASLQKLIDFLKGDYSTVVDVPLWCIGIE